MTTGPSGTRGVTRAGRGGRVWPHLRAIVVLGVVAAAVLWTMAIGAHAASGVKATVRKDLLTVTATTGPDHIVLRLQAGDPDTLVIDVDADGSADFRFARTDFTAILVEGRGGNDRLAVDQANGVFTDTEHTTFDGGAGNDILIGGSGSETFLGGPGNDVIDGNQGNDLILAGDGDDAMVWDPGDGSDRIDGGRGSDLLTVTGNNVSETFRVAAVNGRVGLLRNVGNVLLDLDQLETIRLATAGGADTVTVDDLTGTHVTRIDTDLAAVGGGPDGATDALLVNGTPGDDTIAVVDDGPAVRVQGLAAVVRVTNADATLDRLIVDGRAGNDTITATPAAGQRIQLLLLP